MSVIPQRGFDRLYVAVVRRREPLYEHSSLDVADLTGIRQFLIRGFKVLVRGGVGISVERRQGARKFCCQQICGAMLSSSCAFAGANS